MESHVFWFNLIIQNDIFLTPGSALLLCVPLHLFSTVKYPSDFWRKKGGGNPRLWYLLLSVSSGLVNKAHVFLTSWPSSYNSYISYWFFGFFFFSFCSGALSQLSRAIIVLLNSVSPQLMEHEQDIFNEALIPRGLGGTGPQDDLWRDSNQILSMYLWNPPDELSRGKKEMERESCFCQVNLVTGHFGKVRGLTHCSLASSLL